MDEEKKIIEEKPKEVKKPKARKPKDDFVTRKLKVINEMNNPAKAARLAQRVLANKRKAVK